LLRSESGYDLWLRYNKIENKKVLNDYMRSISEIYFEEFSPITKTAKEELTRALPSLLDIDIPFTSKLRRHGTIVAGKQNSLLALGLSLQDKSKLLGDEGFSISTVTIRGFKCILLFSNSDAGLLYGVFHLLRLLQTHQPINDLNITSVPDTKLRLLNHWDNLDRTVERGYAGMSLWNWHTLPDYIDKRYKDYARANASIGINGTVLTNVNANATVLTTPYLEKVAALATTFRPYGIKVYLTARFSAPIEIGGLKTADPLDSSVRKWWSEKINEIYSIIPDFGGFLVKANSEGQPGPQNYGRSHADGANMLASALQPHNGIVMWRAFVYSNEVPDDRHKQAYNEFIPLDGKFMENVMVQVKNGAIDFQPREPFHPMFGAMPRTPLMMEFQITQEYLGQSTNLVFLAPMYSECLMSDTYVKGKNSLVSEVIDGSLHRYKNTGIAGVSNIGNDINWTGHPFAQANWYAFGRLAWQMEMQPNIIADEWIRMSFNNDQSFVTQVKQMMMRSHEITVRYSTPIGLHHLMGTGHHYGPAPWVSNLSRADWNPVYYHRADSIGIGFDRTSSGTNALEQYAAQVQNEWKDLNKVPQKFLLWFHHVPWDFAMKNGRSLWEELCFQYNSGVDSVRWMANTWEKLKLKVDSERFDQVSTLLKIQEKEAMWWRDACLLYFQTFSKLPIPSQYEKPSNSLDYYKSLQFPFAPGN
jgi:alpha-glucuronidase